MQIKEVCCFSGGLSRLLTHSFFSICLVLVRSLWLASLKYREQIFFILSFSLIVNGVLDICLLCVICCLSSSQVFVVEKRCYFFWQHLGIGAILSYMFLFFCIVIYLLLFLSIHTASYCMLSILEEGPILCWFSWGLQELHSLLTTSTRKELCEIIINKGPHLFPSPWCTQCTFSVLKETRN